MPSHSGACEERVYSSSGALNTNEKGQTTSTSNNMRSLADILRSEWTQTQRHAPRMVPLPGIWGSAKSWFTWVATDVQSLCHVWLSVTTWTATCQASLSCAVSWICSKPCPISRWCHPTVSSSVAPFSSCLHSFPASRSFLMSQLFISGGQILEFQFHHESFQWIFRVDFL